MDPINSCRFVGKLVSFKSNRVGENKILLGKGEILLPDSQFPNKGQIIKINAWEEMAEKLEAVGRGTWLAVLTSYQPSVYKEKLQDTFTVSAVRIYE